MIISALKDCTTTTLEALKDKFHPYRHIMFGKEKYTTEEADLWFKFMSDCHNTPLLSLFAVQSICDLLMIGTGNQKLGGMNDQYLLMPTVNQNGFAFGYTDHHNVFGNILNWSKTLHAIDTYQGCAVIKDKDSGSTFKVPLSWLSDNYLVSVIATLRTITKETIKTTSTL